MRLLSLTAAALLSLPLSATSSQVVEPHRVTIDVTSFAFAPRDIRLAANQQVTLLLVNRSGSGHDFSAPDFFARAKIRAGTVRAGKVDLPPHSTRAIQLAPTAGTYKVKCTHFLHAAFGMKGRIVVN